MKRSARALAFAALAGACAAGNLPRHGDVAEASAEARADVHRVSLARADRRAWIDRGFVEMVPPVRLPTARGGDSRIEVWMRLPRGGRIRGRWIERQGRPTIALPEGTAIDRVEWIASRDENGKLRWTIIDVRGVVIGRGGAQRFYVLRPVSGELAAPLRGWSWQRGDREAQASATRALAAFAARTSIPVREPPLSGRALERVVALNECMRCHIANAPEARFDDGSLATARATDDHGFFVPLSVLDRAVPLSDARPRDPNADDPFVEIRCDLRAARARRLECDGGRVPRGIRRVEAGLAARDEYTERVCASRAHLWAHMDGDARRMFTGVLRECGL